MQPDLGLREVHNRMRDKTGMETTDLEVVSNTKQDRQTITPKIITSVMNPDKTRRGRAGTSDCRVKKTMN